MSIVITGASGQFGRATAEAVLDRVDASKVVLVTRTPDALADLAARGAEVRRGDFDEPSSLPAAFAGGDELLLISMDRAGDRVPQQQAAIDAAAAAGVGRVVYTSILNPSDSNPAGVAAEHRATEERVRARGLGWTFLRNGIYADLQVHSGAAALAAGTLLTNDGDGRTSYVARADLALAAAVVLTSDGHEGKTYDLTGPEALGAADLARLFAEAGGRPVEPAFVDDDAWVAAMVQHAGMPEPVARLYSTFGIAARQGYFAIVSPTLEELIGRPRTTVRELISDSLATAAA
jgi:NAD(P)H dehydrogenase (quinone)